MPPNDDVVLRKQAVEGSVFFGYFLLAKQKKVTRLSCENDEQSAPSRSFKLIKKEILVTPLLKH